MVSIDQKKDTLVNRCWLPLLHLVGLLFLLYYIRKLIKKKRFYDKNDNRARIEHYDYVQDTLKFRRKGSRTLKGSFFHRHIWAFGKENSRVYGIKFSPTADRRIMIDKKNVESLISRNDNVSVEIFGRRTPRKLSAKNVADVYLKPGDGLRLEKNAKITKYLYKI